jgi:serine/threonine protein kinase
VALACGVLDGLAAVHEASSHDGRPLGLSYRWLCPRNVFLDRIRTVALNDLFRACEASLPRPGDEGAPDVGHVSPEEARGAEVGPAADLYATGALLWHALTGRPLWADLSRPEAHARLAAGRVPSLRRAAPALPLALSNARDRALAPDPADRFPTALEMCDALAPSSAWADL